MAPESASQDTPHDDPETYVGLAADAAEQRAYDTGWTTVRTVAPNAVITMEYLTGRLNFAVEDGRVVRCWNG